MESQNGKKGEKSGIQWILLNINRVELLMRREMNFLRDRMIERKGKRDE